MSRDRSCIDKETIVSKSHETVTDRLLASAVELGRCACSRDEPSLLFVAAVKDVTSLLHVEFCSVWELLSDNSLLLLSGGDSADGTTSWETEPLTDSPIGRVILSREPVIVNDLRIGAHFAASSFLRGRNVIGTAAVPILGPQRIVGILGAHTIQPREFSTTELQFLQIVANLLSAPLVGSGKEQVRRQKHLMRAEQMMAIGQVAAGVAHELRNPMTAIKGLIQVNRKELEKRGLPTDDLQVIEHEIRRMEHSLEIFLDFARPPHLRITRLSLGSVIDRVTSLVHGRAEKQQVSVELTRPDEPVWVDADQDQIQQLLLNLVLNALDAMPNGGVINIELRASMDGQVIVQVRDTGPGIAPHILPVVFEKFVSSKETGVGLGLPVSRRIAEDHGGILSAENLPESGALFSLQLPATTTKS
jgi:signal transduction histidine kinase